MTQNRRPSRRRTGEASSFLGRGNGEEMGMPVVDTAAPDPAAENPNKAWLEWLDPRVIVWPERRIRSEYDAGKIAELGQSLADGGQEEAINVRLLESGDYEGAAGENRCMAAIEKGLTEVLCLVRRGSHRDVVEANLSTAINQEQANPLSVVDGIGEAYSQVGLSIDEICRKTGRSQAWVEDRLAIYEASPAVKLCLEKGIIGIGHAALLARIEDLNDQEKMLHQLRTYGWSIKQLEEQIRGGADDGGHEPTQPSGTRQRRAQSCKGCGTENSEVQAVTVCEGCLAGLTKTPEGHVVAPVETLRELETYLAGSPEGAPWATRVNQLLEGE